AAVLDRLERIQLAAAAPAEAPITPVELSFSQLHDFEVCPVRYRFAQVWGVPAPPDELQPRHVAAIGSTDLGAAVHEALAAWHNTGGDLLQLYRGPEAGREMLARYIALPLSGGRTLAVEAGFKMAVGGTRVRGVVDRICEIEGKVALIDFKTNANLDPALMAAYSLQLRIYGLAAHARVTAPEDKGLFWQQTSPDGEWAVHIAETDNKVCYAYLYHHRSAAVGALPIAADVWLYNLTPAPQVAEWTLPDARDRLP